MEDVLNDLALAVLRYDQGLRQFRQEHERHMKATKPVPIRGTPDLEELYEGMLELACDALKHRPKG